MPQFNLGDRVVVDAWLDPVAAGKCHYPADYRAKVTVNDPVEVNTFACRCIQVLTDDGSLLFAPVTCVVQGELGEPKSPS